MTSAPLTPLELRLEVSKCLSNASLDFLDRLYDRRSVAERYLAGDINLHFHGRLAGNGMVCITLNSPASRKVFFKAGMDIEPTLLADTHEMPVFVRIGAITKPFRPITSFVRLQTLDCCDMRGVEAIEEPGGVPTKAIWVIFKRELRKVLLNSRIELRKFKYEIIESSPEIIENFSEQNAHTHPNECLRRQCDPRDVMRGIGIMLNSEGLCLQNEGVSEHIFEVRNMFACPVYSFEATIKRVIEVIDHA